jgi:hypothetical protein
MDNDNNILYESEDGVDSITDLIFAGVDQNNPSAVNRRMSTIQDALYRYRLEIDEKFPLKWVRDFEIKFLFETLGKYGVWSQYNWPEAKREVCLQRHYILDEAKEFNWPLCTYNSRVIAETEQQDLCLGSFFATCIILSAVFLATLFMGISNWNISYLKTNPCQCLGLGIKSIFSLIICLMIDFVSLFSLCVPVLGFVGDMIWAPIVGILVSLIFSNWKLGIFVCIKELLPIIDFIPLVTMCWMIQGIGRRKLFT